ncbi:MAG: epoxyalkane--coenzyme M transferase [Dehalococcoidia bacterium]|nr:epoxyalkane--coenzyme M transferase [Dehalococcoidia bacterium]
MKRSTDRILTTHAGRLPNPSNMEEIIAARTGDQGKHDELVRFGVTEMVSKQVELKNDIHSDGEFWKTRDQRYYDGRTTGVELIPVTVDKPAWILTNQPERCMPEFREFFAVYDAIGNTPMPGVTFQPATQREAVTGPLEYLGQGTIKHEIEVVKAGISAAGADLEDFFFPVLSPGWLSHFLWNEYYQTEEEFFHALADFFKGEYEAVVEAGFVLQIDDPSMVTRYGFPNPPLSIEGYRKHVEMRVEATNYALTNVPEDQVRFHMCWGSQHSPHTTDLPLKNVIDLFLKVNAGAYSIEAADVRHQLDWKLWEDVKLPDGKIFIPGVVAHKTTTIEPPELVADRILTYARIMGRENVIAGTDCGYGNRVYPEIAWAKMRSMAEGARIASEQLWP